LIFWRSFKDCVLRIAWKNCGNFHGSLSAMDFSIFYIKCSKKLEILEKKTKKSFKKFKNSKNISKKFPK